MLRTRAARLVTLTLSVAIAALMSVATAQGTSARAMSLSASTGSASSGHGTLTGTGELKVSLRLDAKRACPAKVMSHNGEHTITVYFEYPNATTGAYEPNLVYSVTRSGVSPAGGSTFVYSKSSTGPVQGMYFWQATAGALHLKSNWTGSFSMTLAPQSGNPGAARHTEVIKGSWSCS